MLGTAEGRWGAGRKLEAGGGRKGIPEEGRAQPKQRLGSWIRAAHAGAGCQTGKGEVGEDCWKGTH